MHSYVDVSVKEQAEIASAVLLGQFYSQLHLWLVERGKGDVAVCFPQAEAGLGLGEVLRVQGPAEALQAMLASERWQRLGDYVRFAPIRPVPAQCGWYRVERRQPKRSAAKVRRMIARGSLSAAEAEKLTSPKPLKMPFVQFKSATNGHCFRLFIDQRPAQKPPEQAQQFNSYGLGGLVAWF